MRRLIGLIALAMVVGAQAQVPTAPVEDEAPMWSETDVPVSKLLFPDGDLLAREEPCADCRGQTEDVGLRLQTLHGASVPKVRILVKMLRPVMKDGTVYYLINRDTGGVEVMYTEPALVYLDEWGFSSTIVKVEECSQAAAIHDGKDGIYQEATLQWDEVSWLHKGDTFVVCPGTVLHWTSQPGEPDGKLRIRTWVVKQKETPSPPPQGHLS